MRHHSYSALTGLLIVGVIIICACQQQPIFEKSASNYYYDLHVYTNNGRYSNEKVTLRKAMILIDGKDQAAISHISGTYFYRVPLNEINTIKFETQGSSGSYGNEGGWRISMRIDTKSGETITTDSIPNFFVRGYQTPYIERILRNDANFFDIKGIQILRRYNVKDLAQQPSQRRPGSSSGNLKSKHDKSGITNSEANKTESRRKNERSRR